jgi:hypothetical protein
VLAHGEKRGNSRDSDAEVVLVPTRRYARADPATPCDDETGWPEVSEQEEKRSRGSLPTQAPQPVAFANRRSSCDAESGSLHPPTASRPRRRAFARPMKVWARDDGRDFSGAHGFPSHLAAGIAHGGNIVCNRPGELRRRLVGCTHSLDALRGNCAERSNENTGLRAIASNIERKKFALNVRHDFHFLAYLMTTAHFWCMRDSTHFHSLPRSPCSRSGSTHAAFGLIEH